MKSRYAILASVLFGLLAMWGLQRYLSEQQGRLRQAEKLSVVLGPAIDLGAGHLLQPDDLERIEIPQRFFHDAMVTEDGLSRVVRKKLRVPLRKGTPLYWKDIEEPSSFLEISTLKAGERLFTVAVDYTTGVGGNLLPGSYVDVLALLRGAGNAPERAVTVLERMRIYSVGPTEVSRAGYGFLQQQYSAVTLVATPQEAEILAYCQSQGRVVLAKRGELDPSLSARPKGVGADTLEQEIRDARARKQGNEK